MNRFAVRDRTTGKYMSRARFDRTWDGAFQLDHPELFDSYAECTEVADKCQGAIITVYLETPVASSGGPASAWDVITQDRDRWKRISLAAEAELKRISEDEPLERFAHYRTLTGALPDDTLEEAITRTQRRAELAECAAEQHLERCVEAERRELALMIELGRLRDGLS